MSININKVFGTVGILGYFSLWGGSIRACQQGLQNLKCDARYLPKYRVEPITDDLGMQIDGHMQTMKRVSPELYDVFMLTYV